MTPNPPSGTPHGRLFRFPALALGALCTLGTARAEVSPYYIGLSQTFTRESNLLRTPENSTLTPVSDTISTTALLGGFDRTIGRQHVYLDGTVRRAKFHDNSRYDNTGYSLRAGIDWSSIERLSGTVNILSNQSLMQSGQASQLSGQFTDERNISNNDQFNAIARVGTVTPLTLEGSYAWQRARYSAAAFKFAEFSQNTFGFNALWRSSALLATGVGLRLKQGRYPQGPFGDDRFTGRNIDLTLAWTPSSLSTLTSRIGYGSTHHDDTAQRNFSGVNGSLQWRWQATGKVRLTTNLSRATGEDAAFLSYFGGLVTGTGNYSRVVDTLSLNGLYQTTAKTAVEAGYSMARRRLTNTTTGNLPTSGVQEGSDATRILTLAVRYNPTRTVQLSCNVGRDTRSASTSLSYAYNARYAGCTGQITLQP